MSELRIGTDQQLAERYEFDGSEARALHLAQGQAQMISAIHKGEVEVKENELRLDRVWIGSSKMLFEAYNGAEFNGTDEEAAQYGLDQMSNQYAAFFNADTRWAEHDSKGLVEVMNGFEKWTPDQQLAFGYMFETYEAKDMTMAGFGRGLRAAGQDYANLATVGGPLALIAKWGGRTAAKKGFSLYLRHWMRKNLALKGIAIGAVDGATVMGYDDARRQKLEADVAGARPEWYPGNQPEEFSVWRQLGAQGTGALFGATLASLVASPAIVRGTKDAISSLDTRGFDLSKTATAVGPVDKVVRPTVANPGYNPKELDSRMPTKPIEKRGSNRWWGSPDKLKATSQALQGIVRRLGPKVDDNLAMSDKSFTWYEDAGATIDNLTRGDPNLKERMVRFLAVYSARTDVQGNTAAAIEAALQFAKGETPTTGMAPNVSAAEMDNLLTIPEFDKRHKLIGNKVMNFYRNLHDPAFSRNDFDDAVTIDRHMLKMMGYTTKNPTDNQYAYAQHVIQEITNKYNEKHGTNLLPRQVQASLWTHQRNVSLQAEGKGVGFASFGTEFARATSHIPWEARTPIYPGFNNLTPNEQIQFTREARQLLLDENGDDIILSKILDHPLYSHMAASGSWEGVVTPNTQSAIVLPRMEGKTGGKFDPSIAKLYASLMGYIYHQDAVPWFRFDPKLDAKVPTNNQGWAISVSEAEADRAFTDALYAYIRKQPGLENIEFTRINLANDEVAFSFINFREDGVPALPDADFLVKMRTATKSFNPPTPIVGKVKYGQIVNEGELIHKGADNEGYRTEIMARGSSHLLDWGSSRRTAFAKLVESWQTHGAEIPSGLKYSRGVE